MNLYSTLKFLLEKPVRLLFRIHVKNAANVPIDGGLIICGNHSSYLDPIMIGAAAKRQVKYMAKSELFKHKALGKFITKLGSFPIHRGENDLTAIKTALKILKSGEVLGIFPQGTRVTSDLAVEAKAGLAMFAYKTKSAVLPVYIRYGKKAGPFHRTDVVFGEVLHFEDINFGGGTKEDFLRVSGEIMAKVDELKNQLS